MGYYEQFLTFISEIFEVEKEEITEDKTPDDLENWNSISHMDLIARFEETFGIELDVEDITEMDSIGAMKRILKDQYGVDL